VEEDKKFMSDIDFNRSSSACSPCIKEVEKINKRLNKRKLEEIDSKEVPHLLKFLIFNFSFLCPS